MKFLVKNKFILIIFVLNFLFSGKCFDNWKINNTIIKNKYFIVTAIVNDNKIKLFYDVSGKIRFETKDNIIISNSESTSKYVIDLNEIYIDYSDKIFNEKIISLLSFDSLKKNIKSISNSSYIFKNKLKFGKTKLYFNSDCNDIDSIIVNKNKYKLTIQKIKFDTLDIGNVENIFSFDLKQNNMEVYDFRFEK
tara:strand:- start:695 stop:1273 length:579 start_codon:yes stop_codon:yes gene_type:complete